MKTILACIFLVCWFVLSFSLSAQPAVDSSRLSRQVAQPLVVVAKDFGYKLREAEVERWVRKGAHFTLYLILGVLSAYVVQRLFGFSHSVCCYCVLACLLVAALDEYHQLFVPGRSAQLLDVGIDLFGASMGIGSIWLFYKLQ